MKQLLYLVISLVVIAAIIPGASAAITRHYVTPFTIIPNGTLQTVNGQYNTTATGNAYCVANVGAGSAVTGAGFRIYAYNTMIVNSTHITTISGETDGGQITYTYTPPSPKSGSFVFGSCGDPVHPSDPNYVYEFYLDVRTWNYQPDYVTANFAGTPLNGTAPLTVVFTDTSIGSPTAWNWTVSPSSGVYASSFTTKNTTMQFTQNGNYTISHGISFGSVSDIEIKSDYIQIYNSTATKTKYFQTIDGTNGNIVLNSSIQLKDVENSSWVNATGLTADGMSHITTLVGHHINAYAQALGYADADDLNILNDGTPRYIMMWPTFAKNVSAGNVSLYVTVKDKDTMANIKGAGVTISPQSGSAQSTFTNDAGIAYFVVKNNTMVYVTAQANGQGYSTGVTTINTGTGSGGSASAAATILLSKNLVTPTFPTVTTLPGGGTPTPTITVLPGCEDTVSEEGQAKCRKAQSNKGLSFLGDNIGNLIMVCVFVTIMYLLGFKLGR